MCCNAFFIAFAKDALARNTAEIGMHLHAWNSPPSDPFDKPCVYAIHYASEMLIQKVTYLTRLLEDTFHTKMISHRAGRWAMDYRYFNVLQQLGYQVDCSVTPLVDWSGYEGAPGLAGGTDYRSYPNHPYLVEYSDPINKGENFLLELPVTIRKLKWKGVDSLRNLCGQNGIGALGYRFLNHYWPVISWLRPNGRNINAMLNLLDSVENETTPYAQFMLHSSELMPGGSPTFPTKKSIDRLYEHLEILFSSASARFKGVSVKEAAKLISDNFLQESFAR